MYRMNCVSRQRIERSNTLCHDCDGYLQKVCEGVRSLDFNRRVESSYFPHPPPQEGGGGWHPLEMRKLPQDQDSDHRKFSSIDSEKLTILLLLHRLRILRRGMPERGQQHTQEQCRLDEGGPLKERTVDETDSDSGPNAPFIVIEQRRPHLDFLCAVSIRFSH